MIRFLISYTISVTCVCFGLYCLLVNFRVSPSLIISLRILRIQRELFEIHCPLAHDSTENSPPPLLYAINFRGSGIIKGIVRDYRSQTNSLPRNNSRHAYFPLQFLNWSSPLFEPLCPSCRDYFSLFSHFVLCSS